MLKNIFDFAKLKEQAERLKEELKRESVIGESGGGMIKVELDGTGNILNIEIEEDLFKGKDKEFIEDLLVASINDGMAKVKTLWEEKMRDHLGLLPFSGLGDLIA
ncbi:YbaB/EbfC family nucleoid-associated protein [candidate division WOR-3 bacterium]|nr:YbaB/EbfC family nucleoid-associated protein [candidate division WOR-3 bacterium]MCK4529165.1 YbaB/EbfC family nucleoid-associated protein [candidate division WOR-3 bacterium]